MRRAHKRAVALITPYPISNAVFGDKVEGVVLRYMFPCDGVISKGIIKINLKPKKEVIVGVKISNETGSASKGFVLEKKVSVIEPNLKVVAGDCLEIAVAPTEEVVNEVWISFLWRPSIADVEAKSYLIEDLEKMIEEV
jgi:hypothetical protein